MMKNILKNQKGISLISLAITVVVLVVVTNVLIYNLRDNLAVENIKGMQNDISNLRDKVTNYYALNDALPINRNLEYTELENLEGIRGANDTGKFYVINLNLLDNLTLNYGEDYEIVKNKNFTAEDNLNNYKDLYIINENSGNIFYVKGVSINGITYYTDYTEEDKDKVAIDDAVTIKHYLIMMENTKSQYKGKDNVGTIEEFRGLVNLGKFEYDLVYLVEDIDIGSDSWEAISELSEGKIFDGQGYSIKGLDMNSNEDSQGLFGENNGTIKNVSIEGVINSSKSYVGGLVGKNNGTITNCISEVEIKGKSYIGGIAGSNSGIITNSKNFKRVEGTINSGNSYVGGIAGNNVANAQISECVNSGRVVSSASITGGITGENTGIIEKCVNLEMIEQKREPDSAREINNAGGIAGIQSTSNNAKIENCYNLEQISGFENVGGIIGSVTSGTINNCYNIGKVVGNKFLGSIVGNNSYNGTIKNCYFLNILETSLYGTNNGSIDSSSSGKTEDYMKSDAFVNVLNGSNNIWKLDAKDEEGNDENGGYPIFIK